MKFAITKADNPDDIIYLHEGKLVKAVMCDLLNTYHYAYEFTSNAPDKTQAEFFDALRFNIDSLDVDTKHNLVDTVIELFVNELKRNGISPYHFSPIAYPRLRSSLNCEVIRRMSRTHYCTVSTFEVIESMNNNYPNIEDDREARTFKAISEAKAILVVDDVTTTGSTLVETVRTIRALNIESPIVIFTIVGKQHL